MLRWQWAVRVGQFVLLMALYLYLGMVRVPEVIGELVSDLLLHGTGYAVAVLSAYVAIVRINRLWIMVLGLWLFSALVEFIQYLLPWRSLSVLDMMANGSGLLFGYLLVRLMYPVLDWITKAIGLNSANHRQVE